MISDFLRVNASMRRRRAPLFESDEMNLPFASSP